MRGSMKHLSAFCVVMRSQTIMCRSLSSHIRPVVFTKVYKHLIYIWQDWLCHPDCWSNLAMCTFFGR